MDSFEKIFCIPEDPNDLSTNILDVKIVGSYVIERFKHLHQLLFDSSKKNGCPLLVLERCETLLLYAWQELNTGKWSDVNINWHKLYAVVSWMKAVATFRSQPEEPAIWTSVVKICDMGHLMGGDVWDDILIRTISNIEKSGLVPSGQNELENPAPKRLKSSKNIPVIRDPVPEINLPSLTDFQSQILPKKKPIVLKGCMEDWPAIAKWSPEYVRKVCGSRTVPVEIGKRYTDDDWGQQLMSISDFIDKYIYMRNNPDQKTAYLAQHDLLSQAPILKNDLLVPDYIAFCGDDDPDLNAWFGPEGTISPLHHDPKHNFLCQVLGEKYIRLYAESESENVYPHESKMLFNTSQVDVENPDLKSFPRFSEAVFQECILKSGDMLYIPPRCWHYVRSLSVSFSVSFWFKDVTDSKS